MLENCRKVARGDKQKAQGKKEENEDDRSNRARGQKRCAGRRDRFESIQQKKRRTSKTFVKIVVFDGKCS